MGSTVGINLYPHNREQYEETTPLFLASYFSRTQRSGIGNTAAATFSDRLLLPSASELEKHYSTHFLWVVSVNKVVCVGHLLHICCNGIAVTLIMNKTIITNIFFFQ